MSSAWPITLQYGETKVVGFLEVYELTDLRENLCHSSTFVLQHFVHLRA